MKGEELRDRTYSFLFVFIKSSLLLLYLISNEIDQRNKWQFAFLLIFTSPLFPFTRKKKTPSESDGFSRGNLLKGMDDTSVTQFLSCSLDYKGANRNWLPFSLSPSQSKLPFHNNIRSISDPAHSFHAFQILQLPSALNKRGNALFTEPSDRTFSDPHQINSQIFQVT